MKSSIRLIGAGSVALAAMTSAALAGGFAINEQSTVFMGSASAGVAAGGSISSMYWNPAATATLPGTNTESSYTLILPQGDVTVTGFGAPNNVPPSKSGNVGIDAATGASYGTYQVSKDLWLGMSLTSPFGLATKPENTSYLGSVLGLTTKLITMDANPTFAYKIAPGITIGAGVQIVWAQGKLQFDETPGANVAQFLGTDWAFGGTAGIMFEPGPGTTFGIGYRSGYKLDLGGSFWQPLAGPAGLGFSGVGTLNLPDLVTASFRHEISPDMRLMGTVEWTNWSVFKDLSVTTAGVPGGALSVPANWDDGWFFSLGGEYDYSRLVTLRGGVAYELSPESSPSKRFTTIPDNNRVWLNLGGSYKWNDATTFDIAYSHIFVQDGSFSRGMVANPPLVVSGTIDASCDLISVGMRTRW